MGAGCTWLLLVAASLGAAVPPGYYNSAQGRFGIDLRRALHGIIAGHQVVPYYSSTLPDTSDALMTLDEDAGDSNSVRLVYSKTSDLKSNFGKTTGWNREHLWPNSYGLNSIQPAYSDLHNLRAADATVNSARGNKFYDISDTNNASHRRPAHAEALETSTDTDSWEPAGSEQGDIARAMFYMDVRYEGDAGEPDLILTETVQRIGSETNFMGRLRTLLRWHLDDPVDDAERRRNNMVFERYQRNRNPFVDHPDWVGLVFYESAGIPQLFVTRDGGNLRIEWAGIFSNATLEATQEIGLPWEAIGAAATNQGGRWMVLSPMTGPARFFRLRVQ